MATFGRYEILDKLGEGAMGVVYRARHAAMGRVVALKMLSNDLGGEEELHQRFQREAEAIGRLNHPNIVTVYDMGDAGGQLYMAMELLEGDDLRSLIERRADIPLPDRVRILRQICDGLAYAHSRQVIHRDIKPANIVVTSTGRVKLLDFGLARNLSAKSNLTRRGVILGTPDYMAPEQALGREVDRRSDVFSAGSVFYEFLSLEKPFKGKTLHSVLYQIISEEPENLVALSPELPTRLAAIVHRMLYKDPDRRYPTMDEVGRAVQEVYVSLRRSRGRSALPQLVPSGVTEDARARIREHVARGRAHLESGRTSRVAEEAIEALALDPGCEEAAELLWRAGRSSVLKEANPRRNPANEDRVSALLSRASESASDTEALAALAELALIAPDDDRVGEALRARMVRRRAGGERT